MTFAVKLKKSEIITITAQKLCTLTITNIALGPHEKNANLYILSKESKEMILIVGLKKEVNTSYSCAIKVLLGSSHSEEFFAEHGQIHIVGNIQQVDNTRQSQPLSTDLITITRRLDKDHGISQEKVENNDVGVSKVQGRPKRSVTFNGGNTPQTQPKVKKQDEPKGKRQKSLLEMMKNVDKEDSSQSDDQSYEQQSEEEESDEEEEEEEEEELKSSKSKQLSDKIQSKKGLKKKSSWAEMLQKEMNSRQDSDQEQQMQEDDDKTPEVRPKRETRRSAPSQPQQKKSTEITSKSVNNRPLSLLSNVQQDSSSFQFAVPNGLPNFLKNQ